MPAAVGVKLAGGARRRGAGVLSGVRLAKGLCVMAMLGAGSLLPARAAAAEAVPPPAQWQWPDVASDPALQRSIIEGGYSAEELANIHEELRILAAVTAQRSGRSGAQQAGSRVPAADGRASDVAGARPLPPYMTADAVLRGRLLEGLDAAYGGRGGPDALAERMNRIESLIAKGDRLWMVWQVSGKHVAPMFGFAPTGKLVQFRAYVMLRFRDGKIAEMETHSDDLSVFQQIGGRLQFPDLSTRQ